MTWLGKMRSLLVAAGGVVSSDYTITKRTDSLLTVGQRTLLVKADDKSKDLKKDEKKACCKDKGSAKKEEAKPAEKKS